MKRELKFRRYNHKAKRWATPAVISGDGYEQYTGLKDRHGKEIYEGDIVRTWSLVESKKHEVKKDKTGNWKAEVIWVGSGFYIKHLDRPGREPLGTYISKPSPAVVKSKIVGVYPNPQGRKSYYGTGQTGYEIIGNIHENPELVK